MDLSHARALLDHASTPLLAAAVIVLLLSVPVSALRWHIILKVRSASPGFGPLSKLLLIGLFFNQLLPSGVGGDAVRVWRCHSLGTEVAVAVQSVLLDRASGYLVMVTLYAVGLPFLLDVLPDAKLKLGAVAVLAAAICIMLAGAAMVRIAATLPHLRMLAPVVELWRVAILLFAAFYRSAAVLLLSGLTIGLTSFACMLVGDGLGNYLSFWVWLLILPPITLIQLLPISLAGWGVREVGLVVMLPAFGVSAEAALTISLMIGLCTIVIGLPGGLLWFADWGLPPSRGAISKLPILG